MISLLNGKMGTETNNTLLAVIIALICVGAIIVAVFVVLRKKRASFVADHSEKLPQIRQLNNKYQFYTLSPVIAIQKNCTSKKEYDRFDPYDYLVGQIADNREYYYELILKTNKNNKRYQNYCHDFSLIMQTVSVSEKDCYSKYGYFQGVEQRICNAEKQTPVVDLCVRITKSYYSAKGRNSYKAYWDIHLADVVSCYNTAGQTEIHKQSAKYQRELMTDSIRYDVMKRDGFKCVICGASAKDGVKLHVDHIFPVSKGGKTEMSNLRTLCDRCNLGKSAKYDPNGLN